MNGSRGYTSQFPRVIITSTRIENGFLLASGKGMAGQHFKDFIVYEGHGFASNPPAGSIGYMMKPGGDGSRGMIALSSHPEKRPDTPAGSAVLYDHNGGIISIIDRAIRHVGASHTLVGDVTVEGNLHATGSITDGDGDGGA